MDLSAISDQANLAFPETADCSGGLNFPAVYEDRSSKLICAVFAFVVTVVDVGLLAGIVWYEQVGAGDQKRTLVNKLMSSTSLSLLAVLVVCLSDLVRYFAGPFSQHVCLLQVMLKNSLMRMGVLFFVAIAVTRYVFIFWLKNPVAVQDRFWNKLLFIWISSFCFLFNFTFYWLPGRQPMNFYTCSDTDPTSDLHLPKKPYLLLDLIGIVLYLLVKVRILAYKLTTKMESATLGPQTLFLADIESQSITDFTTGFVSLCSFFIYSLSLGKINSMTKEELNYGFNYLWMYAVQLVLPGLIVFIFATVHYIRHGPLRASIARELKSAIEEIWERWWH